MALSVDRADLLFEQLCSRARPLRDGLVLLGLFYATKLSAGAAWTLLKGLRAEVWGRVRKTDFRRRYGTWAVVTGCTKGIGKAYVNALAARGMNVVLVGRSKELLDAQRKETVERFHVEVDVVVADFALGECVYGPIKKALENKDVGILVNNVGIISDHPMYFTETSEAFLWDLVHVNVGAATLMARIVLQGMEARRRGAIINLASSAALAPQPLASAYTASKAYVDFFSEALAREASTKGVTVQTVIPFYVCTGMTEFSNLLNKPSLFVPSPEDFVNSALRLLGISSRTTGYWPHSLQYFFSSLVPRSWYVYGSYLLNKNFRAEALRNASKAK